MPESAELLYYKTYRCRLCLTVFRIDESFQRSFPTSMEAVDAHIANGSQIEKHLCPNGNLGIADLAGYMKRAS